jgi:uncharacterized membrane-anchored protein YitT (DUF2179 family)
MTKGMALWKKMVFITAGVFIMAFSLNLFLVPNKIAPGGVSGLATVLHYILGIPTGAAILLMNLPLFLLAIKKLGKEFAFIALYASVITSLAVDYIPLPMVTDDPMLASVFGGVVMGVGLGIIERSGGNTGGTYLAAKLLQGLFPFISVAWVMFAIDFVVVALSAVLFSLELGLFSLVALFISTKVMDMIVEGLSRARMVYIITDHWEEISKKIMEDMERGVTRMAATGVYTGEPKGMLLCVLESNKELSQLKNIIREIDSAAFVIINPASEVMGEGFKSHA